MNTPIPPDFLAKMQMLLGEAYPAFVQSYDAPGQVGLRVNTTWGLNLDQIAVIDWISHALR